MKLKMRDLAASVLVLAIAIPYVGYLVRGDMPFVEDPRGMAAVGLFLGVAAFVAMRWGTAFDTADRLGAWLPFASGAIGVVALFAAETAAAEALLAVFMGSILLVWLYSVLDHVGHLPVLHHRAGTG